MEVGGLWVLPSHAKVPVIWRKIPSVETPARLGVQPQGTIHRICAMCYLGEEDTRSNHAGSGYDSIALSHINLLSGTD